MTLSTNQIPNAPVATALGTDSDVSLRVEHVTKRFGEFTAVDDLSFQVRRGRVFGFLGPNGAGKTTTIRMIVGITAPDEGKIEYNFDERDQYEKGDVRYEKGDVRSENSTSHISHLTSHISSPSHIPHLQDRIGYLPEERGLYKKLKIVDQLKYFAALKNVPAAEADRRIDFWLDRMKLSEWKRKKTTDLSKGMQQKIQFISTVLHDPDLLILDEPFSGLDPVNVEFMIEVLSEFKTKDKTIIFSTHLMETAERLCSDILLINKSRKVVAGSLREVKESFGKNLIALRACGGNGVLQDRSVVARVTEHADEMELQLADDADPQVLLRRLIDGGAVITKFEQIEPSLNDIFIEAVNGGREM
jgi:ABC-2 type transport system ATP-binding protein